MEDVRYHTQTYLLRGGVQYHNYVLRGLGHSGEVSAPLDARDQQGDGDEMRVLAIGEDGLLRVVMPSSGHDHLKLVNVGTAGV